MGEKLRDRNDAQESCPFCRTDEALLANSLAYARLDTFPVTPGHVLIIPLRHEPTFFSVSHEELKSIWELVAKAKQLIDHKFQPDGYNLGVNVGPTSGQTIAHAHLHLIPRYRGDVVNPSGGVRGVIPAKQHYEQEM
jgi:diadenosine tetraphosphate (Ap4A) HIT family hydrolase